MAPLSGASMHMAAAPQSPAATPAAPVPGSSTKLKRKRSPKCIDTADSRFWAEAERSKELRDGFRITCLSKSPEGQRQPINNKRKRIQTLQKLPDCQPNPFPGSNLGDVYYNVEPKRYWQAALRKGLRRCIVEDETDEDVFALEGFIHIRPANDSAHGAEINTWIGKVLEIRAGDAAHVYVRIYWMYRPEDLPGGRRPYHGKNELIASNDMAVIDAHSVECSVDVYHWQDNANKRFDPEEELYWRQTLDVTDRKRTLSQLDTYCIDHHPLNPEQPLLHCEVCNTWLHPACLEENAVKIASRAENIPYARVKKKGRGRPATPPFAAKFTIDNRRPRIKIVDQRRGKKNIARDMLVVCLDCGATIEEVSSRQPDPLRAAGESKEVKDEEVIQGEGEDDDEGEEEALQEEEKAMVATPKTAGAKKDRQSSEDTTPSDSLDPWDTPARLIGSAAAAISSVSRLFRASST